jgi:hypothetical protein
MLKLWYCNLSPWSRAASKYYFGVFLAEIPGARNCPAVFYSESMKILQTDFIIYPTGICIDLSDKHNNLQKQYVQTCHTRMGVFMKNMRKCMKEISHDLGCRSAVWSKYQITRSADLGKSLIVELPFLEHQNSDLNSMNNARTWHDVRPMTSPANIARRHVIGHVSFIVYYVTEFRSEFWCSRNCKTRRLSGEWDNIWIDKPGIIGKLGSSPTISMENFLHVTWMGQWHSRKFTYRKCFRYIFRMGHPK